MKVEEIERRFADGETILAHGAVVQELYLVRSGGVRLAREGVESRILTQGRTFGERGALLSRPSLVQASAQGEASVLALDTALVERLCRECPEFNVRLIRALAELSEGDAAADPAQVPAGFAELCKALLELSRGDAPPAAVEGGLRDIAETAGISVRDAYTGIQLLLERRVLRLVEDQLSVVEPEQLA